MVKNPPAKQEIRVGSMSWEDPLETGTATTPVFLPGEFHDRGTWQDTHHRVIKSWTRLKQLSPHTYTGNINVVEIKEQDLIL